MRYLLITCLAIAVAACNNKGKETDPSAADTIPAPVAEPIEATPVAPARENSIEDSLMKLPFIIESNRYIDSLSAHQRGIAFMRDTTDGRINIRAGYNGPERFETYYDISIDPATNEIMILDPIFGDYITLKEYLKKGGK